MIHRAQPWLGTMVGISVPEPLPDQDAQAGAILNAAINAAFAAVALVHQRMSFHDPASDVAAINRLEPGQSAMVHPQTAVVLRCALLLEEASNGLFNIACGDLLTAWGYLPGGSASVGGPDRTYSLTRNAIKINARGCVTKLHPALIDLGGIAKGHAVDLAVDALRAAGIAAACVNAGGDLRAFGRYDFPVIVRNPRAPTRAGLTLELREQALATSACYFSARRTDGVTRSALVDGNKGTPVTGQHSASVRAPTCMLADGLTKLVIATGDAAHPLLARFSATAFLL